MSRRHNATASEKAEWLHRRLPKIKTWPVRKIIEAMRSQGYFSRKSYWLDCQGVVCDFLRIDRDSHTYGKNKTEATVE